MLTARKDLLTAAVLFLCTLVLFTWGLRTQEIIGFDSRFYLFAQEMLRDGPGLFPTTYHQPYPDYTGASTCLIYLFARLAGGLNKLIAILPTAMLASLTVALTYLIAALRNRRWGLCGVFFLLLTLTFVKSARAMALDMYPAAIAACCFYLLYSADTECKPGRVWWIYPLLLLGFVFRGPIGLVIPAGVICTYYLLSFNIKRLLVAGVLALFILIVACGLLMLAADHAGGPVFVQNVLHMQMLGRMDNHFLPRYFYFTNGMENYALAFPVCWLVLAGLIYYAVVKRQSSADIKLLVQLTGWMLVIVLGMSVPDDKKVRYILAMAPAAALIAAYVFVAPPEQKYFACLRWILLRIFLSLPSVFLLLLLLVYFYADQHGMVLDVNYGVTAAILFGMQLISLLCFYYRVSQPEFVLGIAAFSFAMVNIMVIEPVELYIDRARDFVTHIESERQQAHASLVFYKESPDGLTIKYLINMPQTEQPHFIADPKTLENYPEPAFFVTSQDYFDDLPATLSAHFHLIAKGVLGHIPVIVFKN